MLLLGFFLGMFVGGVFVMTRTDTVREVGTKRAVAPRRTDAN